MGAGHSDASFIYDPFAHWPAIFMNGCDMLWSHNQFNDPSTRSNAIRRSGAIVFSSRNTHVVASAIFLFRLAIHTRYIVFRDETKREERNPIREAVSVAQ